MRKGLTFYFSIKGDIQFIFIDIISHFDLKDKKRKERNIQFCFICYWKCIRNTKKYLVKVSRVLRSFSWVKLNGLKRKMMIMTHN